MGSCQKKRAPTTDFALCRHMRPSARRCAGMVHTQIVCAVAVDGQRLGFPKGVRAPQRDYQALANRCMSPNPAARPTFGEVLEKVRGMANAHPTLRLMLEGSAASQQVQGPRQGPAPGGLFTGDLPVAAPPRVVVSA